MTANAQTPNGFWWCPHCKEEVGSYHVTYQERHESCGNGVWWIDDAETLSAVESLKRDLAAVRVQLELSEKAGWENFEAVQEIDNFLISKSLLTIRHNGGGKEAGRNVAESIADIVSRAERAESALAAAKAEAEALRDDAERYRWLRERLYGFDADFCENGLGVVFKFPEDSRIGVGQALDAAIDAARKG
jgi:hypothetical protein